MQQWNPVNSETQMQTIRCKWPHSNKSSITFIINELRFSLCVSWFHSHNDISWTSRGLDTNVQGHNETVCQCLNKQRRSCFMIKKINIKIKMHVCSVHSTTTTPQAYMTKDPCESYKVWFNDLDLYCPKGGLFSQPVQPRNKQLETIHTIFMYKFILYMPCWA